LQLRIVALGDSTTAGTPGFLSPLEAPPNGRGNLESQYAYWTMKVHPEWTVLNRGINGQRSDEILARFERDVVPEAADYVIILAGVNDVYQGYPSEFVEQNLQAMYSKAFEEDIVPIAATILPYNTASSSESAIINELNRWIENTARRLAIPFCDTHRVVADPNAPNRLSSSPEGLHPDVSGYRRMGEVLAITIESDLVQRQSI
jgi:lysophospholipase L1-like esterase